MRACCWNIDMFMLEALAYPGWEYAGKVYRKLKSMDALSFAAWMLFQEAYPNQPGQNSGVLQEVLTIPRADLATELRHHLRLEMHDVVTYWPSIILCLSTLNTSALAHFCANGLNLDLAKLISLTEIPTLTSLIHTNSSQRQTHPLRGNAIRDWCRVVSEKKAFPKLKLLYLSSIAGEGPSDDVVLHNLSSFPALILVGIERANPSPIASKAERYGLWQCPSKTRELKLNKTMRDAGLSISEKTECLWKYARKISAAQTEDTRRTPDVTPPHAFTYTQSRLLTHVAAHTVQPHSDKALFPLEAEQPVLLTVSCYAPQNTRHVGSATWFVRNISKHLSLEEPPKRTLDTQDHQDKDPRGTKKRKIRQAKQHDVGALLDMFGLPMANGTAS